MRTRVSLFWASVAGATVFTLPNVPMPPTTAHLATALRIFLGYGVLIFLLALIIGFPAASIIERYRARRWWTYLSVASLIGAAIPALLVHPTSANEIGNPFSLVFSPWTRDGVGFAGAAPITLADWIGSLAFGAMVGGSLGLTYWYLISRAARPN